MFTCFDTQSLLLQLVSRLDLPTSGVLPLARSAASELLRAQFTAGLVEKEYWCLCSGKASASSGTISKPLLVKRSSFNSLYAEVSDAGREARSDYQVAEVYEDEKSFPLTLMRVKPFTGRTHQIRAHMASIGFAIVGDPIYGQPELFPWCPRLFLHCHRLCFMDEAIIEAPLPSDLREALRSLDRRDALVSVAERYYKEAPKELELDASIPALSQISCVIHASSSEAAERFFDELRRKTYMTPTSYLELIKLFTDLLGMKKGELDMKLNRYKVGAQRLKETETVVDKLKVDLTKLQPVIEQGKKDTAALIVQAAFRGGIFSGSRSHFNHGPLIFVSPVACFASAPCVWSSAMGNNCCATSDTEGGEVTVNKSVKVSDMVESLHSSSVASADQSLIEKLEGTVWVRKADGNPMAAGSMNHRTVLDIKKSCQWIG
eukprot:s2925_g1.t1